MLLSCSLSGTVPFIPQEVRNSDEDLYQPGTVNSLMTPGFDFGETTRVEGPIMRAIFATIGW